jgi:hypothetical protein
MHYVIVSLKFQSLQNLNRKPSYQRKANALEVVILDKLIQVNRQKLKRYQQMLSEDFKINHPYYVILVFTIFVIKELQNTKLNTRLILESFFVSYYLYSY